MLMKFENKGSKRMSCSMFTIAQAPCDEDVLAIEFAKPNIAPRPEAICIEAVAVVVLY